MKYQSEGNKERVEAYKGLQENMSVARKLFRLFKFFNEYQTIKKTLAAGGDKTSMYLTCLTRLSFLMYWIFDNLGVLLKVKFISGLDMANVNKHANQFWLLGLVLSIAGAIRNLLRSAKDAAKLKKDKASVGQEGGLTEAAYKEAVAKFKATRLTNIFTIIKALGDTTTASQGLGYPKRFFGFDLNDGVVGLGGFTSAALTCYQTYPSK